MKNRMNKYREELKENNLKVTPKREAIIGFFLRNNRYATPEIVWNKLKKSFPHLGLPTVYRNMEQLGKIGILTRVDGTENRFYYGLCRAREPKRHHYHIICQKCRRVNEVENPYFESVRKDVERKTGFRITGHKLQLMGLCRNCR